MSISANDVRLLVAEWLSIQPVLRSLLRYSISMDDCGNIVLELSTPSDLTDARGKTIYFHLQMRTDPVVLEHIHHGLASYLDFTLRRMTTELLLATHQPSTDQIYTTSKVEGE